MKSTSALLCDIIAFLGALCYHPESCPTSGAFPGHFKWLLCSGTGSEARLSIDLLLVSKLPFECGVTHSIVSPFTLSPLSVFSGMHEGHAVCVCQCVSVGVYM